MVQAPFSSRSRPAQAAGSPPLSLAEIGATVAAGLVPLPAESAGYLLLGLADQLVRAPLPLDERGVLLSPEGNVSLLSLTTTSRRANADERTLEGQLRDLLKQMLAYAPGKSPSLSAVAQRSTRGSLAALITELEAALIPVNRSAGRRALARLQREVERERHRVPAAPPRSSPRVRSAAPAPSPTPPRAASPLPPRAASPLSARAVTASPSLRASSPPPPSVRPQVPVKPAPRSVVSEMLAPLIPSLIPPDTAMRAFASPKPAVAVAQAKREEKPLDDATELRAPAVVVADEVRAAVVVDEGRESIVPASIAPLPPEAEQAPTHIDPVALVVTTGHDELITSAPPLGPRSEPVAVVAPMEAPDSGATAEPLAEAVSPPPVASTRASVRPQPARSQPVRGASVRPGRLTGARFQPMQVLSVEPSPSRPVRAVVDAPATVEQLLERFSPSDGLSEREVSRQLKQAVGVELSALPPGVETLMPPAVMWSEEPHAMAPRVEQAMDPLPTYEPRPPRRPRATMVLLTLLVLVGLGAVVATWVRAPGFFLGHGAGAAGATIDASPAGRR